MLPKDFSQVPKARLGAKRSYIDLIYAPFTNMAF